MEVYQQDANARLDYDHDWSTFLAESGDGDGLATSSWATHPDDGPGLVVQDAGIEGTRSRVWISGGQVGDGFRVTNHVTTNGGREDDWTMVVYVTEK